MYFSKFPKIYYQFEINGRTELKVITDIAFNTRFRPEILDNIDIFNEYFIREGETPELISEKLYGTPLYHWVVMLANNKFEVEDFPIAQEQLEEYTYRKYRVAPIPPSTVQEDKLIVIRRQKVLFGNPLIWDYKNQVSNAGDPFTRPVSNIDYEMAMNEAKKTIRVISPNQIGSLIDEFNNLFSVNRKL